jgi:hypothetical protein
MPPIKVKENPTSKIPLLRPMVWARLLSEKIEVRISGGLISPRTVKDIAIKPESIKAPIVRNIAKIKIKAISETVNTKE